MRPGSLFVNAALTLSNTDCNSQGSTDRLVRFGPRFENFGPGSVRSQDFQNLLGPGPSRRRFLKFSEPLGPGPTGIGP